MLTAGAFKPVVLDLMPDFEKQTGHKVTVINDTAGALNQRIRTGETFDIVIRRPTTLEPLAAEGKVVDESMTPFGKVGIGVAVALARRSPTSAASRACAAPCSTRAPSPTSIPRPAAPAASMSRGCSSDGHPLARCSGRACW